MTIPIKRDETQTGRRIRGFDARDDRGRQFGAAAYLIQVDYLPFDGSESRWTCDYSQTNLRGPLITEPTTRFAFQPQALRDGKKYGALQGITEFATEAERDAAVERYFASAEKRALKHKNRAA